MSHTFSVLTYNIQAGIGTQRAHHYLTRAHHQLLPSKTKRRRLRDIGKFISGFDFVCLQEVDVGGRRAGFSNQLETIQDASGHTHSVFQENRAIRTISRHGNAILSRLPFKSVEDLKLPGRIGGRGALVAHVDTQPALVLVCVHLSLGVQDQMEQMEFLADHLNLPQYGRARKIVCGDLNCLARARPIQLFTDLCSLRPLTSAQHKTYPSWAPRQGLDHILSNDSSVSPAITVETALFSDHLAVSAEFD